MRAVIFHAPRDIRLEEVPLPSPGPGEVLLKVGAALTCATDFKAYRRGHPVLLGPLPAAFGHELAGTVAAVGAGVTGVKAGDRVAASNSAPCLEGCFFCDRGETMLCERLKLHNGAYAEHNMVPANIVKSNLWTLPAGLDFKTAALTEPLASAVHGVDLMGAKEGETVAILGAGNMALLLITALRARGCRVIVAGRSRANLETARKAGAHETVSALDGSVEEAVRALTQGRGADCVIEAVGLAETYTQSMAMVRKGGRVCLFGGCAPGTMVPVDAHRLHYQQISLHGVFHHTPRYFKAALDLLAAGKVPVELLVSGTLRLDEVPAFFAKFADASIPKAAVLP